MVQYNPLQYLPTAEELPETDNTPVDNELQILIPTLLRAILALLWSRRTDWFLGVNLGVYYDPQKFAIRPDGFLSLGVQRFKSERGRLSYVLWQEDNVVPQWVLEVVSKAAGGEYDDKLSTYAQMGVLYYVIYNPEYWRRDKHDPFEVYKLVSGTYVRQQGEPFWMPEVGLGIGRSPGTYEGWTREWLYWYSEQGDRLLTPDERRQQAEQQTSETVTQLEQERQLYGKLLAKLRDRGINPDDLL